MAAISRWSLALRVSSVVSLQLLAHRPAAADTQHLRDLRLRQAAVIAEHPGGDGPSERVPAPPPQGRLVHAQMMTYYP